MYSVAIIVAALLVPLLVLLVIAWIASARVQREGFLPGLSRSRTGAEIIDLDGHRLTLQQRGKRALKTEGTWGLAAPDGFARLSAPRPVAPDTVVYCYQTVEGVLRAGDLCAIEAAVHGDDVSVATGFEEVTYSTPLGPVSGWQWMGDPARWMICVHGQSGGAREPLRVAEVGRRLGLSVLVVSYRNDPGAPASEDGLYHLGRTEWQDLEAAVVYATSLGARDITLTGHSMGAAIALWFMHHSALASHVRSLVLDSPLLDFRTAAAWTGRTTGVPPGLLEFALGVARLRFALNWSDYDLRPHIDALEVPVLIFHGDRDGQVPITLSEEVAARRADIVRLHRVPRAGHCQPWNLDPHRYEETLGEFLLANAGAESDARSLAAAE